MKTKIIEATNSRRTSGHIIDASVVSVDISAFIKQIKAEKSWAESDRNAITVFKTNGLSIVLIALRQNAEMIKYKADGLMSVQILAGEIKFTTNHNCNNFKTGQMVVLHNSIEHSILAIEETVLLLTVTTSKRHFTD